MQSEFNESKYCIWVGCKAANCIDIYHGIWLDASQSIADMNKKIAMMLDRSPVTDKSNEWFIGDSYNLGDRVGESESLENVKILVNAIAAYGKALQLYLYHCPFDIAIKDAIANFKEDYLGCYAGSTEFVRQLWSDNGNLDKCLALGLCEHWIDWKTIAQEYRRSQYLIHRDDVNNSYVYKRRNSFVNVSSMPL